MSTVLTVTVLHNLTPHRRPVDAEDRLAPGDALKFVARLPVPANDITETDGATEATDIADAVWRASRQLDRPSLARAYARWRVRPLYDADVLSLTRSDGRGWLLACEPSGWKALPNLSPYLVISFGPATPPAGQAGLVASGAGVGRRTRPGLIGRRTRRRNRRLTRYLTRYLTRSLMRCLTSRRWRGASS